MTETPEELEAIAVVPPPMLVEHCRFCGRLLVPPRMVEVAARSDVRHVQAYGCEECAAQYDLMHDFEEMAIQVQRESECTRDGHWPAAMFYPEWQAEFHRAGAQPLFCGRCGLLRVDI